MDTKNINAIESKKVTELESNTINNKNVDDKDKVIVIKKSSNIFKQRKTSKRSFFQKKESKYNFEIIQIKRIVKVVKGGRKFRFSVLMVGGDNKGTVCYALGKANEIPNAAKKAKVNAEKNAIKIKITPKTKTIPHEVIGRYSSSFVIMYPAKSGTGIIAGGSIRNLIKFSGLKNIYTKAHGSRNKLNLIRATIDGFKQLRTYEEIVELKKATSLEE